MEPNTTNTNGKKIAMWIGVVIAVLLVVWGCYKVVSKGLDNGGQQKTVVLDTAPALGANEHMKGNPNAKVTIIEYSDFECPACRAYAPLFGEILQTYGDKVRVVYRHFPLPQHPSARLAVHFAEAAAKQGKFWEMHDILFANQETWSLKPTEAKQTFLGYAADLKLNITKLNADLAADDKAVEAMIDDSIRGGNILGVDRTPSIYINNIRVIDPQMIKATLDEQVAKTN